MAGYIKFTIPLAINTITTFTSLRAPPASAWMPHSRQNLLRQSHQVERPYNQGPEPQALPPRLLHHRGRPAKIPPH